VASPEKRDKPPDYSPCQGRDSSDAYTLTTLVLVDEGCVTGMLFTLLISNVAVLMAVVPFSELVFIAERFDDDVSERCNSQARVEPKTIAGCKLGMIVGQRLISLGTQNPSVLH
jgi:hypothetical protein